MYLEPLLPLVLALGLLVAFLSAGRRRYTAGAVALIAFSAWPPVDWLVARHLEAWYPVQPFALAEPGPVGAIVVLSSAVSPPQWERPFPLPDEETVRRCEQAAWIFHRWRGAIPVLTSGGTGTGHGRIPFAETMKQWIARSGVPESMIWTEGASRSTYENARLSAPILKARGVTHIALVVDSQSMLRATACFRKLGFAVTPAPSSFRYWKGWREELLPGWQAIRRNEVTLHETLGLAWYRWKGWI